MKQLETLRFNDLDSGKPLYAIFRVDRKRVFLFVSYSGADDTEIAFRVEECGPILALFRRALKIDPDHSQPSEHSQPPLIHRFENLDGGAEAAFMLSARKESLEIVVNRSDEGDLAFCVGFGDVQRIIDLLCEAQKLGSAC